MHGNEIPKKHAHTHTDTPIKNLRRSTVTMWSEKAWRKRNRLNKALSNVNRKHGLGPTSSLILVPMVVRRGMATD